MKHGILLVAFGTSSSQGDVSLKFFDLKVRSLFPTIPVRWAFTSVLLREKLVKGRKKTDSVCKALEKMYYEKFTHVAIQPLQIIQGNEHECLDEDVKSLNDGTKVFTRIGRPLLATDNDIHITATAVLEHLPKERLSCEPVILMGHGAKHKAALSYEKLGKILQTKDPLVYVGTMDGKVSLEHIIPLLHGKVPENSKVWLMPLLSVVGKHTLKDMAGDNSSSWRSRLDAAGFKCQPIIIGTAEYSAFAQIWLEHLQDAFNLLPKN